MLASNTPGASARSVMLAVPRRMWHLRDPLWVKSLLSWLNLEQLSDSGLFYS